ncbi:hypothetical protein D3C78_992250 [compost metagenome]
MMLAVADQHEGLVQQGGYPEKLRLALGAAHRRQQQHVRPVAGLDESAGHRHQLEGQGFIQAAGRLLQHLDGHAARGALVGANDEGGHLGRDDHHGVS